MNALKIFAKIALSAVVIMGMLQLTSKSNLLADQDKDICCEDGDCRPYGIYSRIIQCTETVGIKDIDYNYDDNCGTEDFYQCRVCIDRQNAMTLCKPPEYSNDYCCLVDPDEWGGNCPQQYRYYACDWLTASVSGPSSLLPSQSGTFTATVTGEPSYSYAWYKWRTCGQSCTPEDEGGDTDDLTCCQWKPIGYNSSLQTQDQWDFYLKVEVTDNCWAGQRTVTSSAFYVYVGEVLGKRNAQETTAQLLAGNSEVLNHAFSNYPNPFNAGTTISFSLPQANRVSLVVYNMHGQRVNTLIAEQELTAGQHQIVWNGKNDYGAEIGSGLYLCRITSGNIGKVIRLVMIK
jgi:hypothetical protein